MPRKTWAQRACEQRGFHRAKKTTQALIVCVDCQTWTPASALELHPKQWQTLDTEGVGA